MIFMIIYMWQGVARKVPAFDFWGWPWKSWLLHWGIVGQTELIYIRVKSYVTISIQTWSWNELVNMWERILGCAFIYSGIRRPKVGGFNFLFEISMKITSK